MASSGFIDKVGRISGPGAFFWVFGVQKWIRTDFRGQSQKKWFPDQKNGAESIFLRFWGQKKCSEFKNVLESIFYVSDVIFLVENSFFFDN